jgi:hypothetical protein
MEQAIVGFSRRQVPLGEAHWLTVEMALVAAPGETWVVLREARGLGSPVLTACFEYVSNALRTELVLLRGVREPLRFFHCRYEQRATTHITWSVKEVELALKDERYHSASWLPASDAALTRISETLRLPELPLHNPL